MGGKPIPPIVRDATVHDYLSGLTVRQAAKRHGISKSSVENILRQASIKPRDPNSYTAVAAETVQAIIRDYLAGEEHQRTIATKYGISQSCVSLIVLRHGISKRLTAEEQTRIVSLYQDGASSERLAHKFDVNKSTICSILKRAKVPRRGRRKWFFRESCFRNPTKRSAYWLGFLMADGCLNKACTNSWRLSLLVHRKDAEHLHRFCEEIGLAKKAITSRETKRNSGHVSPAVQVSISHRDLADWLRPWGIVPRKTYRFVTPSIDKSFYAPYLRGWFDGDGSIYTRKDGSGFELVLVNHEKSAMEWYAKALQDIGFEGSYSIHCSARGRSHYWTLHIASRPSVLEFADVLQASRSLCLHRKWDKILDLPRTYFESPSLTEENRQRICDMYRRGATWNNIAAMCRCGQATICKVIREAGIPKRTKRFSKEVQMLWVAHYRNGETQRNIAERYGTDQTTVRSALLRCGVKLRQRPQRHVSRATP